MLAAQYIGKRVIAVREVAAVEPGPGEVQVEVAYTGICGTDLHIIDGVMDQRVNFPAVLGHEMSGVVSAVGDAALGWQVGDPVTAMPLSWCGTCPACVAGHNHICQRLNFLGIDSAGSMQNTWTVPVGVLVRLPSDMALTHGALVEPTAVAVHDVRRADLRPGERVVVVGAGPIGLLIACVARSMRGEIVVLEVDHYRRGVAEAMGFTTVDPTSVDLAGFMDKWTGGAGAGVAFEVSGSQAGLDAAVDLLGVRGRLVVVAIHPVPRGVSLHRVFLRELTLLGARVYQRNDFEGAVALIQSGAVPVDAMISRIIPLDQCAHAFEVVEKRVGVVKVLVDCRPPKGGDGDASEPI